MFPLPDLGEGLTESEIVAWRVAVGDRVELNQIIADVETAKAVVELPSPYAGVITALHAAEGETIDVGAPLFSCDTGEPVAESDASSAPDASAESAASAVQAALDTPAVDTADAAPGPNLVGYGAAAESGPKRRARGGLHSAPAATAAVATVPPHVPVHDAHRHRGRAASPSGRARPRRCASSPATSASTSRPSPARGSAGSSPVTMSRQRHPCRLPSAPRRSRSPSTSSCPNRRTRPTSPAPQQPPTETRIPIRGVRKHTAAAMVRSAFTAPHVTEFLTVDVTATMQLLRRIRDDRALPATRSPRSPSSRRRCASPRVAPRGERAVG